VSAEASGGSSAELKQISVQVDALGEKFTKLVDDVTRKSKAIGDILSRQFADCGKQIDHASERQSEMISKGTEGFKNLAKGVGDFSKSLATLGGVNAKVMEEVSKGLEPLKKVFETFEKGLALFGSVNEALKTMKELTAATSAGSNALDAGKGAKGALAAVKGKGGKAAVAGLEAAGTAGVVTDGALASGATIAGVAVGVAAAGVLVHDGLKTILNWTGLLGGKFETLTGTVSGWYETVKRNDELEKRIERTQEALASYKEQLRDQQEKTRAYYEGREKIRESEKPRHEIAAMREASKAYLGRYPNVHSQEDRAPFDHFDPKKTTKEELALQTQEEEERERFFRNRAHQEQQSKLGKEHQAARDLADQTRAGNDRARQRAAGVAMFPGPATENGKVIDAAGQKRIDDAEAAAGVGGFSNRMRASGGLNPFKSLLGFNEQDKELKKAGLIPEIQPVTIDLQPQLSQQQASLKIATEIRDVEGERSRELLAQVKTMDAQVHATKDAVITARQRLEAEKEHTTATKANFSMLSGAQQTMARDILHKFNTTGKMSREDALMAKQLGLQRGAVGRAINDTLAEGMDKGFDKELRQAGGYEDEDKAQKDLTDTTDRLRKSQEDAGDAFAEFTEQLNTFAGWVDTVTADTKAVGDTEALMGGHKNPSEPPDGKQQDGKQANRPAAAIEKAGDGVVAQVDQMGDAVIAQLGRVEAALGSAVQRIKQANA
jgi:hypothetical protein